MTNASSPRPASKLNRAIAISVAAVAAMNVFVLSQQLQPAPALALGTASGQQA